MFIDVKEFPGLNLILPPLGGIAIHRVCWLVCLLVCSLVCTALCVCLLTCVGPNTSKTVGDRGSIPMGHLWEMAQG